MFHLYKKTQSHYYRMISADFTNYMYENLPVISKWEKIFSFLFYPIDLFLKEKNQYLTFSHKILCSAGRQAKAI